MDYLKGQRVEVRAECGRWDAATVRFISYQVTPPGETRPTRPVVLSVYVQRDCDPRGYEAQYAPQDVRSAGSAADEPEEDWRDEARRNYHADLLPRWMR